VKFKSPEVQDDRGPREGLEATAEEKTMSSEDNLKKQRPEDRQTYSVKLNKQEVKFRSPMVSLRDSKQNPESQESLEVKFRSPEVQNNKDRSSEDNIKKQRPEDRQTYSEKVPGEFRGEI